MVVIALSAHTSDHLQSFHVSFFSSFKTYIGQSYSEHLVRICWKAQKEYRLSGRDFWHGIIEGYNKVVTSGNIKSGFANSRLWPLNAIFIRLNGIRDSSMESRLLISEEFNLRLHHFLLSWKREGLPEARMRGGYVDRTNGIKLTRTYVIE